MAKPAALLGLLLLAHSRAKGLRDEEGRQLIQKIALHPGEGVDAEIEHFVGLHVLNEGVSGIQETCWTPLVDVSQWKTNKKTLELEEESLGRCKLFPTLGNHSTFGVAVSSRKKISLSEVEIFLSYDNKRTLKCKDGKTDGKIKGHVILCGTIEREKLGSAIWGVKLHPGNLAAEMDDEALTYLKLRIHNGQRGKNNFCETKDFEAAQLSTRKTFTVPEKKLGNCAFFRMPGTKYIVDIELREGSSGRKLSASRVEILLDDKKEGVSCGYTDHSINLTGQRKLENVPCGGEKSEGFTPAIWDVVLHPGSKSAEMEEDSTVDARITFKMEQRAEKPLCKTGMIDVSSLREDKELRVDGDGLGHCEAFGIPGKKFTMDVELPGGEEAHPTGSRWASMRKVDVRFNDETSVTCGYGEHSINLVGTDPQEGIPCGDTQGEEFEPGVWNILVHPSAKSKVMKDSIVNAMVILKKKMPDEEEECKTAQFEANELGENKKMDLRTYLGECSAFRIPDKDFTVDVVLAEGVSSGGPLVASMVEVEFTDDTRMHCRKPGGEDIDTGSQDDRETNIPCKKSP